MGFTVEKNNFVSVENLIATLATDLTANGFSLVSVDRAPGSPKSPRKPRDLGGGSLFICPLD